MTIFELDPCVNSSTLDKMAAISQMIFSDAFSVNENFCISIKISLKFVSKGPIDNNPALVEILAWHRIGDKPLSESMLTLFTNTYIGHYGLMSYSIAEQGPSAIRKSIKNSLRLRQNGWCFTDYIFRRIFINLLIQISLKFAPKCLINRQSLLTKGYQSPSKTSYLGLGDYLHFEY